MPDLRLVQLWHHGTKTCRLTPPNESGPYWVVVDDGGKAVSERSFDTRQDAISFAVQELRKISPGC